MACEVCRFTLTLVRHGETEENRARIIQGQKDVPISPHGQWQADLLGKRLSSELFTHVYSSDLKRAMQTADAIRSKNSFHFDIVKDPDLRERGFGSMEGQHLSVLVSAARSARQPVHSFSPPGGETLDQLAARAWHFFNRLCETIWREQALHLMAASSSTGGQIETGIQQAEAIHTTPPPPLVEGNGDVCSSLHPSPPPSSPSPSKCPPDPPRVLVVSHGGLICALVDCFARMPGCKVQRVVAVPNTSTSTFQVSLHQENDHLLPSPSSLPPSSLPPSSLPPSSLPPSSSLSYGRVSVTQLVTCDVQHLNVEQEGRNNKM